MSETDHFRIGKLTVCFAMKNNGKSYDFQKEQLYKRSTKSTDTLHPLIINEKYSVHSKSVRKYLKSISNILLVINRKFLMHHIMSSDGRKKTRQITNVKNRAKIPKFLIAILAKRSISGPKMNDFLNPH